MPSAEELAFLQRIRGRCESDGPRLIFADWLDERGDPHGEFIRVQCALARIGADDPRRPELEARNQKLRDEHGPSWSAPLKGLAEDCEFRRGFVESISINAATFIQCGPELFRLAPIRRVRFLNANDCFKELVECPALKKVRELSLCGSELGNAGVNLLSRSSHLGRLEFLDLGFNSLTDRGIEVLAAMPALAKLRRLVLNDNQRITTPGARHIAESPFLGELRSLDLSGNDLNESSARVLVNSESLKKLDELMLHGNRIGDGGAKALAGSELLSRMLARKPMLELKANGIGPQGARALAQSERLAAVEELNLSGNALLDAGVEALARSVHFKNLKRLILQDCRIGDDGILALLGASWLGKLEDVDVRRNNVTADAAKDLQDAVKEFDWRKQLEVRLDPIPLRAVGRRPRN